jgi:predicted aminopeptidase
MLSIRLRCNERNVRDKRVYGEPKLSSTHISHVNFVSFACIRYSAYSSEPRARTEAEA